MSEAGEVDPYADHDRMENHWWWRPGWKVGTRFYAWHITLDGQDDLHHLMDAYVDGLRPFSTLDPVPPEWRHLTLQGLGHVEGVTDEQRDAAVDAVATRLGRLRPIESIFQRAAIFREAIALPPSNPQAYARLRREIRAGIEEAWGHVPERAEGFRAHTSVAYSDGSSSSRPIRSALDAVAVHPCGVSLNSVSLICMHRDHRAYEWTTVRTLSIGGTELA